MGLLPLVNLVQSCWDVLSPLGLDVVTGLEFEVPLRHAARGPSRERESRLAMMGERRGTLARLDIIAVVCFEKESRRIKEQLMMDECDFLRLNPKSIEVPWADEPEVDTSSPFDRWADWPFVLAFRLSIAEWCLPLVATVGEMLASAALRTEASGSIRISLTRILKQEGRRIRVPGA